MSVTAQKRPPFNPWVAKAMGSSRSIDAEEVRRALQLLADPQHGVELRGLPSGRSIVKAGSDPDGLVAAARELSDDRNVYYALNPVPPGLGRAARVADILARRWLLLDIDPVKPVAHKDDSATEEEHQAAGNVAGDVRDYLAALGWPEPLVIDSGNGCHLLYRIELPNNDHARVLLRTLLHKLAERFDQAAGTIDKAVHNASRIAKLPGTWARKGASTAERPHRMCKLISVPETVEVVPPELLAQTAGVKPTASAAPEAPAPAAEGNGVAPSSPFQGKATDGDRSRYARGALEQEAGRVCLAPVGQRNDALNRAAFALGQLVAGGVLSREVVEQTLTAAASRAGLDTDPGCGPAGIAATIASGMAAGAQQPRGLPERTAPASAGPRPGALQPSGQKAQGPLVIAASKVAPRSVQWLWQNRIPLRKLTTFAGMGGLGKTFVLLDIAARVSRGDEWPDSKGDCCDPGQTLFISGEDDPDDTLVPRLGELNANLDRIHFLRTEALDRFSLADLPTLEAALQQAKGTDLPVRFVAVDPPTAYLNGVDDHKNAELRTLLTPLKNLAAKLGIAIVFNTHINKAQGKVDAMMRVMGSVAWVNAVRSAYMFAREAGDETKRLFLPMKNNLGPEHKGLRYHIVPRPEDRASIEWLGEAETSADEAVNQGGRKPNRAQRALPWLIGLFRTKREWSSSEYWGQGKAAGHSPDALKAACKLLATAGLAPRCRKKGDGWLWSVPDDWPLLTQDWPLQKACASALVAPEDDEVEF